MKEQDHNSNLYYDYYGNAEHKFYVLCFVAYGEHRKKHCDAASESRDYKKRFLGYTKLNLVFLGDLFVVDANDDGYDGDYYKIRQDYGENGIFFYEIKHLFFLRIISWESCL